MKQTCYIIGIFCCYIIGCYIIRKFRSYVIGAYFVTLSGDFVTLSVSCYIIGKFGVTLSVDVTVLGVVTLSGVTGHVLRDKRRKTILIVNSFYFACRGYLSAQRCLLNASFTFSFQKEKNLICPLSAHQVEGNLDIRTGIFRPCDPETERLSVTFHLEGK